MKVVGDIIWSPIQNELLYNGKKEMPGSLHIRASEQHLPDSHVVNLTNAMKMIDWIEQGFDRLMPAEMQKVINEYKGDFPIRALMNIMYAGLQFSPYGMMTRERLVLVAKCLQSTYHKVCEVLNNLDIFKWDSRHRVIYIPSILKEKHNEILSEEYISEFLNNYDINSTVDITLMIKFYYEKRIWRLYNQRCIV